MATPRAKALLGATTHARMPVRRPTADDRDPQAGSSASITPTSRSRSHPGETTSPWSIRSTTRLSTSAAWRCSALVMAQRC